MLIFTEPSNLSFLPEISCEVLTHERAGVDGPPPPTPIPHSVNTTKFPTMPLVTHKITPALATVLLPYCHSSHSRPVFGAALES